ncbi:VOC family protein [Glycomyces tenuis]|uniref:VOC family protein n=1 Tax=Glycomyces tenuis TaxID=58116 RepID=UPI001B7FA91E|nr:VOC family protein [Glycomyces tenuis]
METNTMLSLDVITLGTPDVRAAHDFYTGVLAPLVADYGEWVDLDMHGTGHVGLYGTENLAADAGAEGAPSGFRGYVVSYVLKQPSEVEAVVEAAGRHGAKVLKPAKKALFGAFSGVFEAPDGSIWKVSAPTKKDTGPAGEPPVPTETAALLGVAEPKRSKTFYETLGMTTDRDYGDQYIDFLPAAGTCRFGLMTRAALAKDVGADEGGAGFRAVAFNRTAASRADVDALMERADAAGGRIATPAVEQEWGGYSGHFTDPDGFLWKVACAQ